MHIVKKSNNKIKNSIILFVVFFIVLVISLCHSGIYIDVLYQCKQDEKNIVENDDCYKIELKNNNIIVTKNDKQFWISDKNYKIKNFLICDIDKDNKKEIVATLWKRNKDKMQLKDIINCFVDWQHCISIYDIEKDNINQIWCAEKIESAIEKLSFDDEYKILSTSDIKKYRARWLWQDGKLKNISPSKFDFDKNNDKIINNVKINAFGDNLIHKQIYDHAINENDKSFDFLYENIKDELKDGDINVINQETVFVDDKNKYSTFPLFGTPVENGKAIIDAGFNMITCANNHILDNYEYGIQTTIDFYERNNINYIGISKSETEKIPYKIIEINDIKIAVFNYTYNINHMEYIDYNKEIPYVNILSSEENVQRQLEEGVKKADIAIVFVHWGTEYTTNIDGFQKKWAKIFLENDIDIVIGTHPHVLQKNEILKNDNGNEMLIYYSLGNLVSYQNYYNRIIGGEAKINIAKTNNGIKFVNFDLLPTITHQENDYVTTYMVKDYNDDLAKKHNKILSMKKIDEILENIQIIKKY